MAGNVTGNIGNNDVLLKNMATEETLDQILATLQQVTITKDPNRPANNAAIGANTKAKDKNTASIKKGDGEFKKFITNFGDSAGRVIRNLDSNINNASYAFQAFSRGNGAMSKVFEFAANSVTQMTDQFTSYSKLMQVGGAMTDDFTTLREQAAGLGTDLAGLTRFSSEYTQSLKSGSTSVRDSLQSLNKVFDATVKDDALLTGWGRLGVGVNQISEQILLAAEAQGGYNVVLKRYGGDQKLMSKGVLKSTQELNVFAGAIGMNSKMMQDEAAKAMQKIENRLFVANLSDAQKNQVTAIQALTQSYEGGINVVRSMTDGMTTQGAAQVLATKNILGIGKEFDNLLDLLGKGDTLPEALEKSGLIDAANQISPERLRAASNQMVAFAESGNAEAALGMQNFLTLVNSLKGTTKDNIGERLKKLTEPFNENAPKTVDSFQLLLKQQQTLAFSTAKLNTQINRLGLSLATGTLKGVNSAVDLMGQSTEELKQFAEQLTGIPLPNDILSGGNAAIEAFIQKAIKDGGVTSSGDNTSSSGYKGTVTLRPEALSSKTTVPVKMADGKIVPIPAMDLINNKNNIWAKTNAMGGQTNLPGTIATGAMLTTKIPTLSAITGAGDKYHDNLKDANGQPVNSKHKQGLALDFGVNQVAGKSPEQVYAETANTIKKILKDDYGLGEDEVSVINEYKPPGGAAGAHWTASHIHLEFKKKETADRMRDIIQKQIKSATEISQAPVTENDPNKTVTQLRTDPVSVAMSNDGGMVNNGNNSSEMIVAALDLQSEKILRGFERSTNNLIEAIQNA